MPSYIVTSPEGKRYKINAPEGATKEQALQYAKTKFAPQPEPAPIKPTPLKEEPSIGRTALEQGLQGATLGFSDEVMNRIGALIASKVTGEDYSSLLDEATKSTQSRMKAQLEERPALSIASNLAGSLLTGAAGATTKAGQALTNSLRSGAIVGRDLGLVGRAAKAGAVGASAAGVAGFGAGSGLEDRLESGVDSLGTGAVVGAAFPVAGKLLGKLTSKQIEKFGDYLAKKKSIKSGEIIKPDKAIEKVYSRLSADLSDDEISQALNSYAATKGKSLIQVGGERTKNLAEGAGQYPSGGARAAEFFEQKIGEAPEKIKASLAKNISPEVNYYDTLENVVKSGREKAAPLYQKAFAANKVVQSPIIDRILKTPEGKTALQEAAKNLQNEMTLLSVPDKELSTVANELLGMSQGQIGKGLKLRTLDEVKKAMDSTIHQAYRAGDESQERRIINLKQGLVSELDAQDKSGLYAKARKVSGDYLSNKAAIESGAEFLLDDAQLIANRFKEFGTSEKRAYKVGVMKALRNDIDAKADGQNVARLFNKPANRQKLKSILSPTEYDKLLSDAKAADDIYKLRNQMVGNSRTAQRQIAAEEFNNETQDIISDAAQNGIRPALRKRFILAVRSQFTGLNDKMAKEVADILYETDTKKKYEILRKLTNQAKLSSNSIKATEAANKLSAFYSVSDAIRNARYRGAGVIGLGSSAGTLMEREPARIDINPTREEYQRLGGGTR